jgi:hypothetical protein
VAIKNGQSREPDTTGHTRRSSGNQKRTIQRTRHHRAHKTKKWQSKTNIPENRAHKTKKWQSKTDNPENPTPQGTQDEEKETDNTIGVGHHFAQTNI